MAKINTKLFLKRYSSTILTCVGAVGVVATSILAVKATPKAIIIMEESKKEKGEELTLLETIKEVGPVYIPAVLVGASTIACIFGANIMNKHQQASLMSAYALIDTAYKDYRKKLIDIHGIEEDLNIRKRIAQDNYNDSMQPVIEGKHLFLDFFSLQYFESTIEEVKRAEILFNQMYSIDGYACLNDYYKILGLPSVDYGYDLGWSFYAGANFYNYKDIVFEYEKVELNDDLECYVVTMPYEPTADFIGY